METAAPATKVSRSPVGWFRSPRGILRRKNLTPAAKFLVMGLYEWWNEHGNRDWFYASNRELAAFCGISEPSLISARQHLVKIGWIETKPGHRRSTGKDRLATCYRLSLELRCAVSNNPAPIKSETQDNNFPPLNTSTLVVPKVF